MEIRCIIKKYCKLATPHYQAIQFTHTYAHEDIRYCYKTSYTYLSNNKTRHTTCVHITYIIKNDSSSVVTLLGKELNCWRPILYVYLIIIGLLLLWIVVICEKEQYVIWLLLVVLLFLWLMICYIFFIRWYDICYNILHIQIPLIIIIYKLQPVSNT